MTISTIDNRRIRVGGAVRGLPATADSARIRVGGAVRGLPAVRT